MCFEGVSFIKPDRRLEKEFLKKNYAPMFRKKIHLNKVGNAKLSICCLGIGYCYINDKRICDDLFTAPCSDYTRTLWYNEYDVSEFLETGDNIVAVWCGNGWYNEDFDTTWGHNRAKWRDVPKFILKLEVDDSTVLISDETWKCSPDSAIWFNALRSGEYFDARQYDDQWTQLEYDDSDWEDAIIDDNAPGGVFRKCDCEPIKEFENYKPINIHRTDDGKFIYDIGQNISGYIRLTTKGKPGQQITIRYSELINDDYSRQLNDMDKPYTESEFQTDKFICSGEKISWSPRFTYHGFRYIEITGIEKADDIEIEGVFVHQNLKRTTEFECSNEFLNKLFKSCEISVYSNMFYMLTDCPTREKLGWMNDAQSSAGHILLNFDAEEFFKKWIIDIYDAMREDGSLPGIVPTPGWGYEWGSGPVSDGALFEIPYRIFTTSGNKQPLVESLPYFEKYFEYLDSRRVGDFVSFGLSDWAKPGFLEDWQHCDIPTELINGILEYGFYDKAALAAQLCGRDSTKYINRKEKLRRALINQYINDSGECKVNKQTAVAMFICFDICEDVSVLKEQLRNLLKKSKYHHECGMVGMRWLLHALNKCNLYEYAYKVVTVDGYPGYKDWFTQGATTLWEYWDWDAHSDSKNHHMYTDVMGWIIQTVVGITIYCNAITIKPFFFSDLGMAKGGYITPYGKVSVAWEKYNDLINLSIDVPPGAEVYYDGERLNEGINKYNINTRGDYYEDNKIISRKSKG